MRSHESSPTKRRSYAGIKHPFLPISFFCGFSHALDFACTSTFLGNSVAYPFNTKTIMAKKAKQKKAWELEVEDIDRQIKQLRERKRKLKEQHGVKPKWDDSTPLFEFVNRTQIDRFNNMLKGWEPFLKEKIGTNVKKQNFFKFDLTKASDMAIVIRYLKIAQTHDPKVFILSERGLCSYLSEHSKLGSADRIRKALQRCDLDKWGQKNADKYVPAENADV